MSTEDFEARRRSIWAKHEREFGHPIAAANRDRVEKMLRVNKGDEETLGDLDGYLTENVPLWKDFRKGGPPAEGDSAGAKTKKIYRKCFERRFYLVNFVLGKGYRDRTLRIDWKLTVTEWNKAHPSDTMSRPVLKAEYYRAIKERPLLAQLFIAQVLILKAVQRPPEKYYRDSAKAKQMLESTPEGRQLVANWQREAERARRLEEEYKGQSKAAYNILRDSGLVPGEPVVAGEAGVKPIDIKKKGGKGSEGAHSAEV